MAAEPLRWQTFTAKTRPEVDRTRSASPELDGNSTGVEGGSYRGLLHVAIALVPLECRPWAHLERTVRARGAMSIHFGVMVGMLT